MIKRNHCHFPSMIHTDSSVHIYAMLPGCQISQQMNRLKSMKNAEWSSSVDLKPGNIWAWWGHRVACLAALHWWQFDSVYHGTPGPWECLNLKVANWRPWKSLKSEGGPWNSLKMICYFWKIFIDWKSYWTSCHVTVNSDNSVTLEGIFV